MKNLKLFIISCMIVGMQNNLNAMDSSKSHINTSKVIKTTATALTIASLYLYSQHHPIQSPLESSLRNFANSKYQLALQSPVMKNNGYYYLRGSATNFDCDDDECTHQKPVLRDCDDANNCGNC